MSPLECPWEPEMVRAIAEGRRPERFEDDLREHLEACGACADLIEAGSALARDRESAVQRAPVPAAGAVWWRMQIRIRREAEQAARRTVTLVQGAILGASTLAALGILLWTIGPHVWIGPMVAGADGAGTASVTHAGSWSGWFVPVLAAWFLLILGAVHWALAADGSVPPLSGPREHRWRSPRRLSRDERA